MQVVVVRVLSHAAVEERPRQVVHGVLLVLHRLGDDLGVEVVVEAVIQVRLHRQRLVQELLEEVLSRKETSGLLSLSYGRCFTEKISGLRTFLEP